MDIFPKMNMPRDAIKRIYSPVLFSNQILSN